MKKRDEPHYSDVPIRLYQEADTPEGEDRLKSWLRDNDLSLDGFRWWLEPGGAYYRQKARK